MNRRLLIIGAAIAAIIVIPIAYWLIAPLFVDQTVDEAFPFELPSAAEVDAMDAAAASAAVDEAMDMVDEAFVESLSAEAAADLEDRLMALSAKMPDKTMDDAMPADADAWLVVAQGAFRDADEFHRGEGVATVYQQGDRRVLRFEDFSVTNGPDLHVLLVENPDATSHDEIGAYVDLGSLTGNRGNQNYEIPADIDLSAYGGIMIYCMPFHVVFATAPLG